MDYSVIGRVQFMIHISVFRVDQSCDQKFAPQKILKLHPRL